MSASITTCYTHYTSPFPPCRFLSPSNTCNIVWERRIVEEKQEKKMGVEEEKIARSQRRIIIMKLKRKEFEHCLLVLFFLFTILVLSRRRAESDTLEFENDMGGFWGSSFLYSMSLTVTVKNTRTRFPRSHFTHRIELLF